MVCDFSRQMTRPLTSIDIARRAGVSRATVSAVLNNRHALRISAKTKIRVLAAAQGLGYVPNSAAQMLVSGKSRTLGLILSRPDLLRVDAFAPRLILGVGRVCDQRGYKLLIEVPERPITSDDYVALAGSKRIDGLVVFNPQPGDKGLIKLIESGFPVIVSGSIGHQDENSVGTPNKTAARTATRHLISLGHKRIAHIPFASLTYSGASDRFAGYRLALRSAKLKYDEQLFEPADFSAQSGYDAMKRILSRRKTLTALFAGNDTIALGAMAALREKGLRIPEDVAVVGYDNLANAQFAYPPLTTIDSHAVEQGELVAFAALALMDGETVGSQQDLMKLNLIVRESCGANLRKSAPTQSSLRPD